MTDSGRSGSRRWPRDSAKGELLALRWDDVDVDAATLMSDPKRGHHRIARLPRPMAPPYGAPRAHMRSGTVRSRRQRSASRARAREV